MKCDFRDGMLECKLEASEFYIAASLKNRVVCRCKYHVIKFRPSMIQESYVYSSYEAATAALAMQAL